MSAMSSPRSPVRRRNSKPSRKVELKPGQTKTITFTLDREAFWYFDAVKNAWATEPGEFEILVGASSRDIRLNDMVTLAPEPRGLTLPYRPHHPDSAGPSRKPRCCDQICRRLPAHGGHENGNGYDPRAGCQPTIPTIFHRKRSRRLRRNLAGIK